MAGQCPPLRFKREAWLGTWRGWRLRCRPICRTAFATSARSYSSSRSSTASFSASALIFASDARRNRNQYRSVSSLIQRRRSVADAGQHLADDIDHAQSAASPPPARSPRRKRLDACRPKRIAPSISIRCSRCGGAVRTFDSRYCAFCADSPSEHSSDSIRLFDLSVSCVSGGMTCRPASAVRLSCIAAIVDSSWKN